MVIYLITNLINGKNYIGQTVKKNPWKRINAHFALYKSSKKYAIHRAIEKYGRDSFEVKIIDTATTQEQLDELERKYIIQYESLGPNGYNQKTGGLGGSKLLPDKIKEVAKKVSKALKGRTYTDAHKASMSKSRKGFDSQNRKNARRKMHHASQVSIIATNIQTGEIYTFSSIVECANTLELDATNVSRAYRGDQNRSQSGGYTFKSSLITKKT